MLPAEKSNPIFHKFLVNDSGRHAIQNDDGSYSNCRPGNITEDLLAQHFKGDITLATYSLSDQNTARWMVIDYDISSRDNAHTINWAQARQTVKNQIIKKLSTIGIPPEALLVSYTGGRGVHVYVLFKTPLSRELILSFRKIIIANIDLSVEIYPDERDISSTPQLIRLPGLHRKYGTYSKYWDMDCIDIDDCNLWDLEKLGIERLSEPELKEIIATADKKKCTGGIDAILRRCRAFQCIKDIIETEHHINNNTRVYVVQILLRLENGEDEIHNFFKNLSDYSPAKTQYHIDKIKTYLPAVCQSFRKESWCDGHCAEINRINSKTPLSFAYTNQTPIIEKWRGVINLLEGDTPVFQYMGPRDWQVYERLVFYSNMETRKAFPSIETLARDLRCSRFSVMRAISTLKSLNLIRIEQEKKNKYRYNIYSLSFPPFINVSVAPPHVVEKNSTKTTTIPRSKIELVDGQSSKVELSLYKKSNSNKGAVNENQRF